MKGRKMACSERIPLPLLSRKLIASGFGGVPYQRIYTKVVSGEIPADQTNGNRWTVNSDDLPMIAATLGLTQQAA